eukprot:UN22924
MDRSYSLLGTHTCTDHDSRIYHGVGYTFDTCKAKCDATCDTCGGFYGNFDENNPTTQSSDGSCWTCPGGNNQTGGAVNGYQMYSTTEHGLVVHFDAQESIEFRELVHNYNIETLGNGLPAYTQEGLNQPTYDTNGGLGGRMYDVPRTPQTTVLVVAAIGQNIGQWGNIFHHGSRDNDYSFEMNGNQMHWQTHNDNSSCRLDYVFDEPCIWIMTNDSGVRTFSKMCSDGLKTDSTACTVYSAVSSGPNVFYVGMSDAGEASNSLISELQVYNGIFPDDELNAKVDYLYSKWLVEDINECLENPCDGNATCTDKDDGFDCLCTNGYKGDGFSCQDIDECLENQCHSDAICTNNDGGFECLCNNGYSGDGFNCQDIDECLLTAVPLCHSDAICINQEGTFDCSCNNGFAGDGFNCQDVDECFDNSHQCDENSRCDNTNGGYNCTCNDGYDGDGFTCSDIDECRDMPCNVNGECENLPGSFACACKNGYRGDGFDCQDIDECLENSDNCDTNAECTNVVGDFDCTCKTGYDGSGVNCNDVDECIEGVDNCDQDADCTNNIGGFVCHCKTGFRGDGLSCARLGCTDFLANNYDEFAEIDDESCVYLGCTDDRAANFKSNAREDDGSCLYSESFVDNLEDEIEEFKRLIDLNEMDRLESTVEDL